MQLLSVTNAGRGAGSVINANGAINCKASCDHSVSFGSMVPLTAIPEPGSQFVGWLGDCSGRGACTVTVTKKSNVIATFAPIDVKLSMDIDGNGTYDALTDGFLAMRYMYGLTGENLIARMEIGNSAGLLARLDDVRPLLDIDGNGQLDALYDGLLLQRYLFGLRGPTLVKGAVAAGATRTSFSEIEAYIKSLMP